MAKGIIDLYLAYSFLRRIVSPFESWDAFKLGVIDKEGKILIPKKERTSEQSKSLGYYDVMVMNLKKLLGKIPGGKTRIASFAAALLLLKEHKNEKSVLIESDSVYKQKELLNQSIIESSEYESIIDEMFDMIDEEAMVTTSAVAGVKSGDEPPVNPMKRKKMLKRLKMF